MKLLLVIITLLFILTLFIIKYNPKLYWQESDKSLTLFLFYDSYKNRRRIRKFIVLFTINNNQ